MGDTIPWAGILDLKKRKLKKKRCDQLPPIPSTTARVPMSFRVMNPQTARQQQTFLPQVVFCRGSGHNHKKSD